MERTTRTRNRTPSTRPSDAPAPVRPAGNRLCGNCPAWPEASFRHGELVRVEIVHYHWCGRPRALQPIRDWLGAVDLNELRRRHISGQTGY
jgi:hypothetical protein